VFWAKDKSKGSRVRGLDQEEGEEQGDGEEDGEEEKRAGKSKKELNPAEVLENISSMVKSEAEKMAEAVMGEGKQDNWQR
jgi:hypothetical protein